MSQTTEIEGEAPEGYKRVQLGPKTLPVPTDWEIKRVDEITENLDRKREPIKSSERDSGDIPYYGATGQVDSVSGHLFDEKLVLVGEDGADWSPFGGTSYIISGKSWVNNHVHVLRCTNIVEEFLSNYLDYIEMRQVISGTNRGKLNQSELNQFPVLYPPLPEQRRIADILSTVDEQIQQTDEMIEKTAELKRGLMQDLITGGIGHTAYKQTQLGPREVEIPDKWAVERMDDVAEIVSGGTPKKSTEEYWGGDIVWVTPTDVTGTEGMYISDSAEKITEEGLANASTHMLEPGSVLMTSRATIGEAVINTVPATTNQGFKSLVPEDRIHNEYLYYYVRTIADYLTEIGGGSTFPEINKTDTKNIRVPIPPLDEQKRIADVINQADKKRLEERKHKQHLQELKRGLMQDLLTGKVRVNTD